MKDLKSISFFADSKIEYITDSLTSVLTKEATMQYMEHLISSKTPFALFFVDIDDFKEINDNLGHQIGDQALIDVSHQLMETIENDGVVGRFGGDEFMVVIDSLMDYNQVWNHCRHISQSIRKKKLEYIYDYALSGSVSVTIGTARYPEDANNLKDLIIASDKALYRGKSKGKNCFIIYTKELHAKIKTTEEGGKLEVENIVEYLFSEFSVNNKTPLENLIRTASFLANYYNVDLISITNDDDFKVLCNNNESIIPCHVPIGLFLKSCNNDAVSAFNYRMHLQELNPELYFYFESQEIRASIFIRCATKKKIYCYLRVDNRRERVWSKEERYIFQLMGNLYAFALEKSENE